MEVSCVAFTILKDFIGIVNGNSRYPPPKESSIPLLSPEYDMSFFP